MKILLDYVFPITVITPTPQASTGFLKAVVLVCNPKSGQDGNVGTIYDCTTMTQVAARTDNVEAQQLFNAGLSVVKILLSDDLDLSDAMLTYKGDFFTVLVSSDFTDVDVLGVKASLVKSNLTFIATAYGAAGDNISVAFITGGSAGSEVVTVVGNAISVSMASGTSTASQLKTALDNNAAAAALISTVVASGQGGTAQTAFALAHLATGVDAMATGTFDGVTGVSSTSEAFCAAQVTIANRCAFFTANGAKNMCFAFGSLLANPSNWLNQQYITMPFDDGVDELGDANQMFDDKVSFVLHDDEFGNKLALFSAQAQAIVAPYILKNLRIDLQSRALQWISANQPTYTVKEASLLETRLQEDVIQGYIDDNEIESGTVTITVTPGSNFTATGNISVPQPKALWRVLGQMTETA